MTQHRFEQTPSRARTGDQAPTLADVARRAGVSTATVSRCLNSPGLVVEETRERVLQAVRDLGYAPNFGARVLAAKRTDTFGAIIPTMNNAIFARGIQAFQEELGRHGITLLVASSSYRPELEAKQVHALVARGADALLLIGYERAAEVYDFLDRRAVPYLLAWVHDPTKPFPAIGFDNRAAMQGLAERVLAIGHRRVGMISGILAGNDRARDRHAGVAAAIAAAGLDGDALRVVETSYAIEDGARAFRDLMQTAPRPSVIMCGNDVLAAGALIGARELGLRVPADVSITGFDDIELARIVTPALTTVHVPHRAMGEQAARLLIGLRDGQPPDGGVRLHAEMRMRESLGPPSDSP